MSQSGNRTGNTGSQKPCVVIPFPRRDAAMAKLLRAAFPFMLHDLDRISFDPVTGLPTNLGGPDAAA